MINFLFKFIKRTPRTRFIFFFASDVFLIALALVLSFYLRFDFTLPREYWPYLAQYFLITLAVLLPIFYLHRLYHFTWIYVGLNNLITIFRATTYGFLFLGLLLFLGRYSNLAINLPRSIILIDYFLVFTFISGLRISKRLYSELFNAGDIHKGKQRILIVGAGDGAEQIIRSIKQIKDYPYDLFGVLDDSEIKQRTSIHGISVLGKIKDLPKLKQRENIYGIIIAIPSAGSPEINKIVTLAQQAGIFYIKTLPSFQEFLDNRVTIKDVRDIDVEDLLGRKKIDISLKSIAAFISGKRILITGAAGSIGFELVRQISKINPSSMLVLDTDETGIFDVELYLKNTWVSYKTHVCSILQKDKINAIFASYKPNIVFHAAAYKHVKLMEREADQAVLNNVLGTWNLANAAIHHNVEKFVFISTDKAVNPTSVMGMSKRLCEMLIRFCDGKTKFISVRFGNVLGSRGSVVPLFKKQILSGGPVTVTHKDMQRYFMVPSEAILLILQAAQLGEGGEIFVLDMGRPVKILDLAQTMIRLAGFEPYKDIPIIFTHPEDGEKLFEEILTDKEHMNLTRYQEIFISPDDKKNTLSKEEFFGQLEGLIEIAKEGKNEEVKENLKGLTI